MFRKLILTAVLTAATLLATAGAAHAQLGGFTKPLTNGSVDPFNKNNKLGGHIELPKNEPPTFHSRVNQPAPAPGNQFRVDCGAVLSRVNGNDFRLNYDSGPAATLRYVGTSGNQMLFDYVGGGQPPYGIWRIGVTGGNQVLKYYQGKSEPVAHQGWAGRWDK